MFYKTYLFVFIILLLSNCTSDNLNKNKINIIPENNYSNKGFALVYSEDLNSKKIISKKLDERSLTIFQKNLKKNTQVKITNIINRRSLIAKVGNKSNYPLFNNSVLSPRIANELKLDLDEPYIEIIAITKNSLFVAKKAKTFDEEKNVANKVPVNLISINDLNETKKIKIKNSYKNFSYIIKIADFYFKDTASTLAKRIVKETDVTKPKIKKVSDKKYRVYLGPFDNIITLKKSFNDISILQFENIEIIKND